MKIVGVILATFAVGFVAFQNCQKAPHPDDLTATSIDGTSSTNKIDLQGLKISDVSFNFTENETVTRNSGSYQLVVNKSLKVLLPGGQMTLSSDLNSQTQKYCLTETLSNELVSILKSSQVCKNQGAPTGQVCTQALKLPYAVVTTENETFALGGSTDGCGTNSIDFCGQQIDVLKVYIASVKANYKSFVCP